MCLSVKREQHFDALHSLHCSVGSLALGSVLVLVLHLMICFTYSLMNSATIMIYDYKTTGGPTAQICTVDMMIPTLRSLSSMKYKYEYSYVQVSYSPHKTWAVVVESVLLV